MAEAKLVETEGGLEPADDGWFVVNVRDACWWRNEVFGAAVGFEGETENTEFPQVGFNIRVLQPGQPACLYHGENAQEAFLVLQGECLLLVEGEERPLRTWDFVHLPAWTEHVCVGAGDGPSAVLMIGARTADEALRYPVSDLARK
jgi:uncharacterized cupin superfamily protein